LPTTKTPKRKMAARKSLRLEGRNKQEVHTGETTSEEDVGEPKKKKKATGITIGKKGLHPLRPIMKVRMMIVRMKMVSPQQGRLHEQTHIEQTLMKKEEEMKWIVFNQPHSGKQM
jgi:hypothetical protein